MHIAVTNQISKCNHNYIQFTCKATSITHLVGAEPVLSPVSSSVSAPDYVGYSRSWSLPCPLTSPRPSCSAYECVLPA